MLQIEFLSTSCKITLRCRPHNPNDELTLFQAMAWCRHSTNHYLSQCWPRSMSPYGGTMPQWVDMCVYISNTFLLLCIYDILIHAWFSWSIINWYPTPMAWHCLSSIVKLWVQFISLFFFCCCFIFYECGKKEILHMEHQHCCHGICALPWLTNYINITTNLMEL